MVSFGFSRCLGGSTFIGTVSLFAAMEAEFLSNASCSVGRGKFSEVDCVYIHSVGVVGG